MAKSSARLGTRIYCVDTWLGSIEHVIEATRMDKIPRDACGSATLYHQFLRNFAEKPEAGRIVPIQQSSVTAARMLAQQGVQANLIYIDGSHSYEECYLDMMAYWPLLASGGVMFGDDFRDFPGVFGAVVRFSTERDLKLGEVDRKFWMLKKP